MTLPTGKAAQAWRRWFQRHPTPPDSWDELPEREHPAERARPPSPARVSESIRTPESDDRADS